MYIVLTSCSQVRRKEVVGWFESCPNYVRCGSVMHCQLDVDSNEGTLNAVERHVSQQPILLALKCRFPGNLCS